MYLTRLYCYDVDSYCSVFEDQETDYSRGRRFFSDPYSPVRLSQGLEICAHHAPKH